MNSGLNYSEIDPLNLSGKQSLLFVMFPLDFCELCIEYSRKCNVFGVQSAGIMIILYHGFRKSLLF